MSYQGSDMEAENYDFHPENVQFGRMPFGSRAFPDQGMFMQDEMFPPGKTGHDGGGVGGLVSVIAGLCESLSLFGISVPQVLFIFLCKFDYDI